MAAIGAAAAWSFLWGPLALLAPGRPMPDFRLATAEGAVFHLTAHRGNVVVLNFLASWRGHCNAEAPHLERLWKEYRKRGVQVVGIDVAEPAETAARYRNRHALTHPVVRSPELASALEELGVN